MRSVRKVERNIRRSRNNRARSYKPHGDASAELRTAQRCAYPQKGATSQHHATGAEFQSRYSELNIHGSRPVGPYGRGRHYLANPSGTPSKKQWEQRLVINRASLFLQACSSTEGANGIPMKLPRLRLSTACHSLQWVQGFRQSASTVSYFMWPTISARVKSGRQIAYRRTPKPVHQWLIY